MYCLLKLEASAYFYQLNTIVIVAKMTIVTK